MTWIAFGLIFSSALLHAVWHFISKSRYPTYGFFLVFSFSLMLTMLPLLLLSGIDIGNLPLRLRLCALGGAFFGTLSSIGLSYAYRYSDISLAYPVARSLPVLLTAVATAIFGIGSRQGGVVLAGMGVIFAGCLLMSFAASGKMTLSAYRNKGMYGILLASVGTTLYTIFDSYGVRAMNALAPDVNRLLSAGTYSCLREMTAFPMLALAVFLHSGERKKFTCQIWGTPHVYLAGFFAALAYVLILTAMEFVSNVSYVQAFRQLSLPIGMLLGVVFLKEKATRQKITALLLIMTGLLLVTLG